MAFRVWQEMAFSLRYSMHSLNYPASFNFSIFHIQVSDVQKSVRVYRPVYVMCWTSRTLTKVGVERMMDLTGDMQHLVRSGTSATPPSPYIPVPKPLFWATEEIGGYDSYSYFYIIFYERFILE